jgi:hypothetical protein
MRKTTIAIGLSIFVVFGVGTAVQAGSRDDDPPSSGGYRIGPLGQVLGGPYAWRGRPPDVYAYAPRSRLNRAWYYENARSASPMR